MRRFLAILVLAVLQLPTIALAFQSDPEANLPACCRRFGKHRCVMMNMGGHAHASPGFHDAQVPCSSYPSGKAVSTGIAGLIAPSLALNSPLTLAAHSVYTAETWHRVSLAQAHGQRGPPLFLQS